MRAWSPAFGGDAHAGRVETSLMLALAPELVGAARAGGQRRAAARAACRRCARAACARSRPNGVLGDAAGATAEEGRALLAGAVADLVAFVDAWRVDRPQPDNPPRTVAA